MSLLLCLLSGTPAATTVKHYLIPAGGGMDQKQEMPPAQFLVIEAAPEKPESGALLYRFDSKGECVGDTWHRSVEDAKKDAAGEYEGLVQDWQSISDGVDINALVDSLRTQN
jgi:hypothetical protein